MVMLLVSCAASGILPPGAEPAVIVDAAKNSLAVKSWPLLAWLAKVSVTALPAARRMGFGPKLKLATSMVSAEGAGVCATAGATSATGTAAATNKRNQNIGGLLMPA